MRPPRPPQSRRSSRSSGGPPRVLPITSSEVLGLVVWPLPTQLTSRGAGRSMPRRHRQAMEARDVCRRRRGSPCRHGRLGTPDPRVSPHDAGRRAVKVHWAAQLGTRNGRGHGMTVTGRFAWPRPPCRWCRNPGRPGSSHSGRPGRASASRGGPSSRPALNTSGMAAPPG